MQILDYVLIGIAVIGLIVGLVRGFISQLLALLGIVAVAVGTSYLFKFPQQWLSPVISDEKIASIVAIVLTVIVLSVVYGLLAHFIKKSFSSVKIVRGIDKVLGGVLGFAIVCALVMVAVEAITRTDIEFLARISELVAPHVENSVIVKSVNANNFLGKWIFDVISKSIAQLA